MKNKILFSLLFVLTMVYQGIAQRTVTGTVTDDLGEGLPGVNVVIKGTTTGSVTDFNGNYNVQAEDANTLVFSFVGFESQEIVVGSQSVIDVLLGGATELEEVVVTAVGIERIERALGYAVATVGGDETQQVSEPDAIRALQGKIAGVNIISSSGAPGSSTRLTIRGNSSLLNQNQPLFVVDGVPYNNDAVSSAGVNSAIGGLNGGGAFGSMISTLDPNSIESITVLKGGSAAALYGSRGANGVVVITTKGGSASASAKKTEVTVSSSFSIEKISNLPNYQNTYGVGTAFSYAQANGSWGHPFKGTRPYASLDSIPHWFDGRVGLERYWGTNVPYRAYPNNVKDFFESGTLQENSININGGNETSVINVTITQLSQKGFVPNSKYDKYSFSLGTRTQLKSGLNIGSNFAYTRSDQDGAISGVGALGSNNPSAFARTLYLGRNWDLQGQIYQNPSDKGSEFFVARGQANNPYWAVENTGIKNQTDRYVGSLNLSYDVTDWLTLLWRPGFNGYNTTVTEFQRAGSTGGGGIGSLSEFNVRFTELNSDFIASVRKDFTDKFGVTANLGWNVNQRTREGQQVAGTGYVIHDIDDLDNLTSVVATGGNFTRRRLYGVYFESTFSYSNWAFLNITGRNDWTSTLPTSNNSFFYPAVSASVIVSDLLDFESNTINLVKIRAGYSKVGNDTNPYQIQDVYFVNNAINTNPNPTAAKPFNGRASMTLNNVAKNANLKPENTTELELGFNVIALKNKIDIDFAFYKKNTTDQIISAPLAEETGFSAAVLNTGEVENRGIELAVGLGLLQLQNSFSWNLRTTFTHNKNLVISTGDLDEIQFGSAFAGNVIATHRAGEEYGLLLGSADEKDDEGNLLIDPSNGQHIQSLTREIIGNPNPDFKMGFVNTFSYKGFSFRAVMDWTQGGDLYSNTVLSMQGRGILESQADRERNWIIPGVYGDPNTGEPIRTETGEKIKNTTMIETNSLYFGQSYAINGANEWSVFDATVIRLREVSLSYDLPKSIIDSTPFGSVRFSLTGRNLWFSAPNFPDDTNFDPETSQFGNRNNQGIEYSTTPSAKRYSVNLRFTF